MKILLINKYYYVKGGSETYFFGLKAMLEKNGHDVLVFSMEDIKNFSSPYSDYFVNNVDYEDNSFLNKVSNSINLINSKESYEKLSKLIKDFMPDIAHVNLIYHQLTPSVFHALEKYNIPTVFTAHDYKIICPNYKLFNKGEICRKCINGKYYNCFLNKCHKDSTMKSLLVMIEAYYHKIKKSYLYPRYIICPSKFMYNELLSSGIQEDRLIHIDNFITEQFINMANGKIGEYKDNYIVYFGRLSQEKDVETIIKSMQYVNSNIHLKIIGTGSEEMKLKDLAKSLNIKNIEFCGFKNGEDLINLISRSRCSIISSKWNEVFGLTIIESFYLGTSVIGSNVGAIPELVEEGKTGYIFEVGNEIDLADKINIITGKSEVEQKEIILECKKQAEKFISQKYYNKLIKIYEKLNTNYEEMI